MGSIEANGLGKVYKSYVRQAHRALEWITGDRVVRHSEHWVLQDINFSIAAGESVAIVGQNGAGKSTLLKLIAGVLRPNAGSLRVQGRLTALLELGMGFHNEFTGRQNLRMASQLVGVDNRSLEQLSEWIIDFADIGDYIDEPLRTYSSGMQMRLAFAVAVARRPEILIVDEALSVGDIFFQQKCFDLIRDYNRLGTTLLFVTHGMGAVQHLCQRAMLLDHGRLRLDGSPKEVIDLYESLQLAKRDARPESLEVAEGGGDMGSVGSLTSDAVDVLGVEWLDADGAPLLSVVSDHHVRLRVCLRARRDLEDPHVGFKLRDKRGLVVYETNTYCQHVFPGRLPAGATIAVDFDFDAHVREGEYNVTLGIANHGYSIGSFREQLCYAHGLAPLTVLRDTSIGLWDGVANLRPSIGVTALADSV